MLSKNIITLSLITVAVLQATDVDVPTISVESTIITEVSQKAQVSADLAKALSSSIPSIDMNRRSAIANDIYIRGQKRDNISIDVDGTKVYGAGINRMDPPISHILTNQIDDVEVIEGPYDVENFGTLSGGVKIKTKKPTKDLKAEIDFGLGSFNYKKAGVTINGGNDLIRILLSTSYETSNQYKDGNGDTISEQVDKYANIHPSAKGTRYKAQYRDMDAYTKKSIMTKAYVSVTNNQELRLSYTANRSDDILYGNSPMDALSDDSNIYGIEYNIDNITNSYKNINLKYYYSDVDHPMATKYRISSNNPMMNITNHLKSKMEGIKLKSTFNISSYKLLVGLDGSRRTWDGNYYNTTTGSALMAGNSKSVDDTETENTAIFAKVEKFFNDLSLKAGVRIDNTDIKNTLTNQSSSYSGFNANILASYNLTNEDKIFFGFGQASRVPDARELYFKMPNANLVGTPNLDKTTNREIDLGYEANYNNFDFKLKAFYSILDDYIYIKKGAMMNAFTNIDATIYGTELTASYYATDDLTIDTGLSYKRGKKDDQLSGQTDKDLADIAPLRGNINLNYEYMKQSVVSVELQASDKWTVIDSDNGEQKLDSWAVLNLKLKHHVNKNTDLTLGINNLFDETYAVNNTYADLILISAGGTSNVMLMNEPGRYVYTNLTFKF